MKLKEAQLLGVLAVIAIGIVLLCTWGQQPPATDEVAVQDEPPEAASVTGKTFSALYDELFDQGAAGEPQSTPIAEEQQQYNIVVGPGQTTASEEVNEDAAIRTAIEDTAPERIRLTKLDSAGTLQQQASEQATLQRPADITHVVAKGETLSSISKKYYNTASKWPQILAANKQVLTDPRRLMPKMRLRIPAAPVGEVAQAVVKSPTPRLEATTTKTDEKAYTVVKGDTLYRIALKRYGDGGRWKDLLKANQALLKDSTDIWPGMKLRIP